VLNLLRTFYKLEEPISL